MTDMTDMIPLTSSSLVCVNCGRSCCTDSDRLDYVCPDCRGPLTITEWWVRYSLTDCKPQ